jgi:hypothetical protein
MAGLDPAIFFQATDARIKSAHDAIMKLDPDFRQGDEENKRRRED